MDATVSCTGLLLYDPTGATVIVQRAFKDLSILGDNELVAAVPNKRIRGLALAIQTALAVTVRLKSAGNNISAAWALALNQNYVLAMNEHGWFETNIGEALNMNATVANAGGVQIVFVLV